MVRIITDTTAGLPADVALKYGITVIPQVIHFGGDSYLEGIDIDNTGFLQRLKTSKELPKTAAPPPELFAEQFRKLVPQGGSILCIHPSSDLSGTVRSANTAKTEFPDADIHVIDTRVAGSPLATLVRLAAQWAVEGKDADAIDRAIHDMSLRCHTYFVVATLEYLAKGGRIGGAAALVGTFLQVRPILALHDGKVDVIERERTQKRAVMRLKELVYDKVPRDREAYVSIMHAAAAVEANALADEISNTLNIHSIPILDVPPAITIHAGPGVLAVAFFS